MQSCPQCFVVLQKELYFLLSMKHIIIYLFHKSSYHPYKAPSGHIFISPTWMDRLTDIAVAVGSHSWCQTDLHVSLLLSLSCHETLSNKKIYLISIWKDCCEELMRIYICTDNTFTPTSRSSHTHPNIYCTCMLCVTAGTSKQPLKCGCIFIIWST